MTSRHEALRQSTKDQLKSIIERYERLEEEKAALTSDQKDIMAEAKSHGFDTKAIREIIKIRKQGDDKHAEEAAVLATYMHALGMDLPLFTAPTSAPKTEARQVREMEDA